jgi:hypothetical protein
MTGSDRRDDLARRRPSSVEDDQDYGTDGSDQRLDDEQPPRFHWPPQ